MMCRSGGKVDENDRTRKTGRGAGRPMDLDWRPASACCASGYGQAWRLPFNLVFTSGAISVHTFLVISTQSTPACNISGKPIAYNDGWLLALDLVLVGQSLLQYSCLVRTTGFLAGQWSRRASSLAFVNVSFPTFQDQGLKYVNLPVICAPL